MIDSKGEVLLKKVGYSYRKIIQTWENMKLLRKYKRYHNLSCGTTVWLQRSVKGRAFQKKHNCFYYTYLITCISEYCEYWKFNNHLCNNDWKKQLQQVTEDFSHWLRYSCFHGFTEHTQKIHLSYLVNINSRMCKSKLH